MAIKYLGGGIVEGIKGTAILASTGWTFGSSSSITSGTGITVSGTAQNYSYYDLGTTVPCTDNMVIDYDLTRNSGDYYDHPMLHLRNTLAQHGDVPNNGDSKIMLCYWANGNTGDSNGTVATHSQFKESGTVDEKSASATYCQDVGTTLYYRFYISKSGDTTRKVRVSAWTSDANRTAEGSTGRELDVVSSSALGSGWSSADDLKYLIVENKNGQNVAWTLSNMKIWSNVQSTGVADNLLNDTPTKEFTFTDIPAVDEKATITNVPAGTRFHETDTKKVFGRYYAGKFDSSQSWVEKGTAGYLTQDTSLNSSLATGGYNGSAVINTTETFSGGVWSASHTLNEAQRGLHAGGGTSTSAMCAGGNNNSWTNLSSTEKLASGSWASDTALPVARYYTSGGGSPTNFLISHGNNTTQERANSLEYNGTSWSNLSGIGWSCYASATGGNATDGLTFGGNTGSTVTNSAKYDGSSWTSTNVLNSARYIHGGDGNSTDAVAYNGAQGSSTLRDNEKFNGTSWASIGNGLHGYSRYGATICGKSSGAIGGFGKANSVYMTSTELWDGTSFSASGNSQSGREYGAGGYAN